MDKLNNNQIIFCNEYVNNGGNGTQAYLTAYKSCKKEETAKVNASRLLTKANIQAYVKELQEQLEDKSIMNAKERMKWLSKVINGDIKHTSYGSDGHSYESEAYTSDKLKAIDILNKMSGEYITKLEGDIGVTTVRVDIEDE